MYLTHSHSIHNLISQLLPVPWLHSGGRVCWRARLYPRQTIGQPHQLKGLFREIYKKNIIVLKYGMRVVRSIKIFGHSYILQLDNFKGSDQGILSLLNYQIQAFSRDIALKQEYFVSVRNSYSWCDLIVLYPIPGLLQMMQAFIAPTYAILAKQDGLRDHPGTVDDFFRQGHIFYIPHILIRRGCGLATFSGSIWIKH